MCNGCLQIFCWVEDLQDDCYYMELRMAGNDRFEYWYDVFAFWLINYLTNMDTPQYVRLVNNNIFSFKKSCSSLLLPLSKLKRYANRHSSILCLQTLINHLLNSQSKTGYKSIIMKQLNSNKSIVLLPHPREKSNPKKYAKMCIVLRLLDWYRWLERNPKRLVTNLKHQLLVFCCFSKTTRLK